MADPGSGPDSDKQKGDFGKEQDGKFSSPGKVGPNSGFDATKELARNELERNKNAAAQAAMNAKNFSPGLASAMYGTKYGATIAGAPSFKQFVEQQGITPDNPYGKQGFFSKFFGLDPKNVKYKNINSAGIAYNNYSKFINPTNDPNLPGYNNQFATAQPGELRKGLQTLFSTPETYYGPVQSNFEQLGLAGAGALGVASLGLPGVGLLAPREYGIAGTPFTPGFQNVDESPYSTALRAVLGIGTGEVSRATSATKTGIESLADRLRSAFSPDTAASPAQSVTQQSPVQGFEDAKSQFSTGVSRPDVNLNVKPSKGLQGFFDEATPDSPVPGVSVDPLADGMSRLTFPDGRTTTMNADGTINSFGLY